MQRDGSTSFSTGALLRYRKFRTKKTAKLFETWRLHIGYKFLLRLGVIIIVIIHKGV
tara:strand:- start:978 stop:1148 length:171 start_codon:yes stop_codon:yes gene_type:complete